MTLGIVGHEAAKFTEANELEVRDRIRKQIRRGFTRVVSGACPLGGVDVWAIEEARALLGAAAVQEFPPAVNEWARGFRPRNIQIAEASDLVVCYVVDRLPAGYTGRRFDRCYHCVNEPGRGRDHVKSGGCWTVRHARSIGKLGRIEVVPQ